MAENEPQENPIEIGTPGDGGGRGQGETDNAPTTTAVSAGGPKDVNDGNQ